ncbi:MAG: InlB B-repeat-containing protein [Paludibacteraceae bacterium]|nr:InlB B-repeat-containing protein [Paludibacteraceae bacterium]
MSSSTPANGATDVAVSGNITLTFSENVTINDASKFTLSGGAGTLNTASATASGTVVTIPYSGLANNTTYTLATAAEAVKDGSNNKNAALGNISFTTVAAADPLGSHTLTWNITTVSGSSESNVSGGTTDIGTTSTASTSTYLTSLTDLAGVGVKRTTTGKNSNTGKIETPSSYDADKYVTMTFAVASGYQFTPSSVSIKTVAVSTTKDLKLEISDASGSYSVTKTSLSTSSTAATNTLDFSGCDRAFTGTVTVKIYVYGAADQYRLSTPLTIDGTVAAAVTPSCTAPNHVDITSSTGEFGFFGGETINLTAQAYSSAGTGSPIAEGSITGYQWKHNGVNIAGATSKTYRKERCTVEDAGDYSCVVSTGATCSTESDLYGTKVYVLQNYTGGTTTYNFTRTGSSKAGTAEVTLANNTQYQFKIYAGSTASTDYYMGNNGTIEQDISNWDFEGGKNNVKLNSGLGGTFTFAIDYTANGGAPKISVTYPRKTIYMKCGSTWCDASPVFFAHTYGVSDYDVKLTQNVCDATVYQADIPAYNSTVIFTRQKPGSESIAWNGDNFWNQSKAITLSTYDLFTCTGWDNGEGTFSSGTYSPSTFTITFAGNGSDGGSMSSISSIVCDADLALTANAFTKTGHTFANWTADVDVKVSGATVTAGNAIANSATIQNIRSNIALTAQWTAKNYTITLNGNGGTGHTANVTAMYNSATLAAITNPSRDCYSFDGWYSGEGGTGTLIINTSGVLQAGTTYTGAGGIWTNDGNVTLYAKWTKTPTSLTVSRSGAEATPAGGSPIGTEYTLTCSAATGSISSYQWKQNTSGTKAGAVNAVGTGTTSANFHPVPAATGDYWYFCVATDACGNEVETSLSGCFTFTAPRYSIIYAANLDGATGSTASTTDQEAGYSELAKACGYSKSGYKFKWWNTAANGSGEDFYVGETVTLGSANLTLYAQWEEVPSGWEFWVGSPNEFTSSKITVGDMVLTGNSIGSSHIACNTDLTADPTIVNNSNKHATVIAVAGDNDYLQVHFSDGAPINSLLLGATTNKSSSKNIVVCFSTTADFSTGEYEFKGSNVVSVPGYNQSTKSVTTVSPSTANKYSYARIYRKLTNGTQYNSTGSDLGSGNTVRIYSIKAQKGTITYTGLSVTKDPSAGSASAPTISATSVAQGSGVTVTAGSAASGYAFLGWESENGTFADASSLSTTFTPTANNAVATARYAAVRTITIKFLHNGNTAGWVIQGCTTYPSAQASNIAVSGDWVVMTFSNVYAVSNIDLARAGGDWDYLNTSTKITDDACYKWNGDVMSCAEYSVTYADGGATSGSVPVDGNTYYTSATVTVLGNTGSLAKTGYNFAGWSDGVNTYTAGNTFSMPGGAVTLTAQWTIKTATITIDANTANHGSTTPGTVTATYGSALPSFTAASGASGYSLTGYYTAATDGTKIINADGTLVASTSYADGSGHWNSEVGSLTLYAQYVAEVYHVTYDGNSPTSGSAPTDVTNYSSGDEVTVLGNTGSLAKTGYTFRGWTDGTTFFLAGQKFNITGNVTLTAVWDGGSGCTTTLVDIDFTNKGASTSYTGGNTYTLDGTSVYFKSTMTTHTDGSYLNLPGNATTSSNYMAVPLAEINGEITITVTHNSTRPQWKHNFTGLNAAATASNLSTQPSTVSENTRPSSNTTTSTWTISTDKSYGVFYIGKGSNGTSQFEGLKIMTPCSSSGYTVTYADGSVAPASHISWPDNIVGVPSGKKILAPANPTAAGYTFGGWYKDAGCSNAWNFASDVVSSDVTIYAKWLNCRPVITTQPSGAVYVLGNVPAALNVVATGDVTGYQWYSNDENNATSGTLIAGATTAGYTPELSIIGTTYYYCVVTNACGSTTTNVVAIVCNDSRANPTATWTVAEPTHGGQGFSFSVTAYQNDNISLWDGTLTVAMLTASEGVVLGEVTVDNTTKTISGTYGVEASATSPVTFYLSLPGTTNCCAATLDYNRTFTACAGGAGDSYNVRVRKDYEKDASNNYRWVTAGAGEITYAVGSSISSAKASSAVGVFDSIMSNDKQYLWIKTYEANTKTVRIHVLTGGKNISVSTIYQNTNYAAVADKDIVSSDDYSVTYDGSGSAENFGAKGIHYVDIEFDSPLEANDIICVKFSTSNVKAYGAVLTTVGDGGTQTTTLAWSNSQASGATLTKQEDDIDFAVTATRNNPAAIASLGAISYTSSNTAIATINSSTGLVHIADDIDFGEAAYKTTTITATLAASGCYKKATITYTLQVNKHVCEEAAGTISYVDNGCSGMTLSVSGYEDGATIQWYKDNSPVGTNSATYNATTAGEYHVVTTKTCSMTSTNSIVLALASASAEKIVDEWYVKNGRRTPDIALVQTTDARSFTVTSGGSTITEIGGCTFELKDDGIIYLHGSKPDGSAPSGLSAGDMTITITVSGCGGALSGLDIVIHKQDATTRPSIAFVVDGTEGGSFDAENESHSINTALYQFLDHGSDNLGAFDLTGQNIYSTVDEKAIRQHYSQFDAIVITDDPNTGTKSGSTSYVDAFGTMIDIRPILSMEAYVSKLKNWGSKGVAGSPSSPNPRQYEMRLQCKDHEIYSDLPAPAPGTHVWSEIIDGEEYRHVIMVDSTQSPYAGVAYNEQTAGDKLPALQGFASEDMGHLLGLGLILNGTLHAGVERQEEPAARMMILGIQSKALPNALTDEGKKVIENAITYLLKTNMEEVDDCSNFFKGGDSSKPRDWQTVANWYKGTLPTYETKVRILAPCELSGATVRVAQVDIVSSGTSSKMPGGTCSGSLTIASDAALIVTGKVRSAEAPHFASNDLKPTELGDLTIKADETNGNGTLIFDNKDGNTQAVVEMYSKAQNSVGSWSWQYVAVPFNDNSSAYRNYYGSWLYRWAEDNSGWEVVPNRGAVYPWIGYCLTQETAKQYVMDGTLVETTEQEFTVGSNQDMVIGNSWTAPIQVKQFTDDDFGGLTKNIYLFNTGLDVKKEGTINPVGTDGDARYEAGTYVVVPIHSAEYTGDSLISSLQAFTINNSSGSDATLTLDYDRHIRPTRSTDKVNAGPMHAPKRMAEESDKPVVLKILVSGDRYDDRLVLLEREDFSRGYDAGWDGEKILIGGNSQEIFSVMESGQESVTATPDMDGTVIGFRAGEDDIYTFHFEYDGYDEPLYLLDTDTKIFTRVVTGNIYTFMCTDKRESNRFLLTRKNAQDAPTDNANIRDEYSKPLKFLNNDKIYIYVRGVLYDITGKVVK